MKEDEQQELYERAQKHLAIDQWRHQIQQKNLKQKQVSSSYHKSKLVMLLCVDSVDHVFASFTGVFVIRLYGEWSWVIYVNWYMDFR